MPSLTVALGAVLVALGAYSYTQSVTRSPMALIPAIFGLLFVVCGLLARNPAMRKHAMHGAAALGLVGLLAGLGPLMMGGTRRFPPLMVYTTGLMAALCGVFLILAVRSFIAARRERLGAAA